MQLEKFKINGRASVRDALAVIESNHHGIVFCVDEHDVVVGVVTDGDIRRKLLQGKTLADPIVSFANCDFTWQRFDAPREALLKKLDHRIRAIPLLDDQRRLRDVASRDHLPVQTEEPTYARARAPVRISFGGGGSDLTHYFAEESGAVINTTVSLYSHATMRARDDGRIVIHSSDLGQSLVADDLQAALAMPGPFGLLQGLLQAVRPSFGFELFLCSDFPMRSGLGGSAVVSAAVLGCFNQFRRDRWDLHELAELAFQAERLHLGIAGGWQDQYATVFGGFNFMEFRMDQNIVHPLRIPPDTILELEESLLLCDTGIAHDSGDIHQDQRRKMLSSDVQKHVRDNVDLCYRMRNQLLRGQLSQFGQCLDEAWRLKRLLSDRISSAKLDGIYESARANGSTGGKLLGAGGGGFFLFFVPPFRKLELMASLRAGGLNVRPFRFEPQGLCAWTARDRGAFGAAS